LLYPVMRGSVAIAGTNSEALNYIPTSQRPLAR
jgi:hypothetical protein